MNFCFYVLDASARHSGTLQAVVVGVYVLRFTADSNEYYNSKSSH